MADFFDPRFQGLLTLASGLLSQSGWQPNRVGLGEAFGNAGMQSLQAMRQAQLYNQQAEQQKLMMGLHNANMQKIQYDLQQQQALPGQLRDWQNAYNGVAGNALGPQTPMGPVNTAPSQPGPYSDNYAMPGANPPVLPTSPKSDVTAPDVGVTGSRSQSLYDLADQLDAKLSSFPNLHPEVQKRAEAQIAGIRARADRMLKIEESNSAAPKRDFMPVGNINGIPHEQQIEWDRKSQSWKNVGQPRPIFSTTPVANVEVNTGESFWKQFGTGQAKFLTEQQDKATEAATAIGVIHDMRANLDKGMITGAGANAALNFGRVLSKAGFQAAQDPVANTQAYAAESGNLVGQIIKQFGSGTGLSDADREYAKQIAAGDVSLDEKALRRLLDIREKANRIIIQRYNKRAEQVKGRAGSNLPIDIGVEEPPAYSPPNKSRGPTATNPKTGEKLEFRDGKWQPLR